MTTASRAYRCYVIAVLLAAYICNYIDRSIISMLMEPVRKEFDLTDGQLGLLIGPAFVLLYALSGIPIARLADRANRVDVMSACVAVWSIMVMLCGLALNFWQLLIARVGVGIGESGCTPPAHSLIADYFPPPQRTRAISAYMLGMPLGTFASYLFGGWLNQAYGWRLTFCIVAAPGILLALLLKLTLKEPARGAFGGLRSDVTHLTFREALTALWRRRTLRNLSIGISLATIATATAGSWMPTFLIRSHAMSTGTLGSWLAAATGIGGGLGIWLGGSVASRLGADDGRRRMNIVGAAIALIAPALLAVLLVPTQKAALILLFPANFFLFFWFGPAFSLIQELSDSRARATTVATLLFVQVLVGGFGGGQLVGTLSSLLEPAFGVDSLRWAMSIAVPAALWASLHYLIAARSLEKDV